MMNLQEAREILDRKWEDRRRTIVWIECEDFIRRTLESELILDPWVKLALIAEAIGAWTGRGTPEVKG